MKLAAYKKGRSLILVTLKNASTRTTIKTIRRKADQPVRHLERLQESRLTGKYHGLAERETVYLPLDIVEGKMTW